MGKLDPSVTDSWDMSMAQVEVPASFGERVQMMLSTCRWTEKETPNQTLRSCTMITVEESSILAGLQARRVALQHELSEVNRQIHRAEQAQARLEERIKILEKGQRQAA
jgi:hypothetical protein